MSHADSADKKAKASERSKRWRRKNREHTAHYSQAYFRQLREPLMELFGNRCFVCHQKKPRLEFHHIDYPNGKLRSWQLYNEVKLHPQNFRLVCGHCHAMVTWATNHPIDFIRLLEIIKG